MPRRAASITQADVARALRAAQAAGPFDGEKHIRLARDHDAAIGGRLRDRARQRNPKDRFEHFPLDGPAGSESPAMSDSRG